MIKESKEPHFMGKMDLLGKKHFIQACVWPNSIMLHILDFFENSEEVAKKCIKIFQVFKKEKGVLPKNKIVIIYENCIFH